MTGVEGRPEVIVEGSMDGEHWTVSLTVPYPAPSACECIVFSSVGI